jgi:hypothetical protein
MRIRSTLKRLTDRGPSPWPVLSVYVNTRPVGPQMATYRPLLKKRMAEELKALHPRSSEYESLNVDFARVQHYLDYDLREGTRSAAVFACYADNDLFDAVQIPIDFEENTVTAGPLPSLFPLLRVADRYRRAAVLVADTHTARLFCIALAAIEVRREVRNPALHKPRAAGDADPATVQRHVENEWKRHARQAVQALEDLAHETESAWILVGGDPVIVPALLAELSTAARARLIGHHAWDIRIAEADLAATVDERVREREAADRRAAVGVLIGEAARGQAAAGIGKVVAALRESRVRALYLSEAFPAAAPAWACRACRAFGAGEGVTTCPLCGRGPVEGVLLREEMASQAVARGGEVLFVAPGAVPDFDAGDGVAAALRFA